MEKSEVKIAAEVHQIYLETAKNLGWPIRPEVDVPYDQLDDNAKSLDVVIAKYCIAKQGLAYIAGLSAALDIAKATNPLDNSGSKLNILEAIANEIEMVK